MIVKPAVDGMKGFDVNQPLNAQQCKDFIEIGMSFAIRYIPRMPELAAGNLTNPEMNVILSSGLALSVVQHCPRPSWNPTADIGEVYGEYAVEYCRLIGLPQKMNIWLDLEEVSSAATVEETIAYCQAWYSKVAEGNYIPAIYVGYAPGIDSERLYRDLSFARFWKAYNYDDGVHTRGFCIIQHPQRTIAGLQVDPDTVQKDELGDLPIFLFGS